jgi:hypothetical protein
MRIKGVLDISGIHFSTFQEEIWFPFAKPLKCKRKNDDDIKILEEQFNLVTLKKISKKKKHLRYYLFTI